MDSARQSFDRAYNELAQYIVSGEFAKMINQSKLSTPVEAKTYLSAISYIKEKQISLDSQIMSIAAVSKGSLSAGTEVNLNDRQQAIPNHRNIDMSSLVEFYQIRMQGLIALANNSSVKIKLPTGGFQIITENALNPVFNVPIYTKDDITRMKEEISNLRTIEERTDSLFNSQAAEVRRLVQSFVTIYGSSESYRFTDERDEEARNKAYKDIQDIFWTRSYLRLKYGIGLGAIQLTPLKKKKINLERFTVLTSTLRSFRPEVAHTELELAEATANAREIMEIADERSMDILSDDPNATFLVRANAFLTYIGGQTKTAESLQMILRLVAADISEEKMLLEPGGLLKLRDFYRVRYQGTTASKNYYSSLKCNYDSFAQNCGSDPYRDVINNSSASLRSLFNEINMDLTGNSANLDLARKLEDQLREAILSMNGVESNNSNRRTDDL